MIRRLAIAAAVLCSCNLASAQPRIIEIQPQPHSLRNLQESQEQLEATLDVKRAYVKAAEVGVLAAKAKYNRVSGGPAADVDQAKIEVDMALAMLDIRKAEMREVDVRLKQVKKRLDEMPAAVPTPKVPPFPLPNPNPGVKPLIEEPGAAGTRLDVEVKLAKAKVEKARAAHELAKTDVVRLKKLAETGIVPPKGVLAAEQGATVAELDVLIAQTELQLAEVKLKESKQPLRPAPLPKSK